MNELLMRGGRVSVPFNCFSFTVLKKSSSDIIERVGDSNFPC
jgi:hypothetical protein